MGGKYLTDLERLARDICWMGFSRKGRREKTKASYWDSLPEFTKKNYRDHASEFIWYINKFSDARIAKLRRR
jgi:hypothetical protein